MQLAERSRYRTRELIASKIDVLQIAQLAKEIGNGTLQLIVAQIKMR